MALIIYNTEHPDIPFKNLGSKELESALIALTKEKINIKSEDNETLGGIPVKVTCFSFGSWKLEHVISKKDSEWYRIKLWNSEKGIFGEFDSEKHTPHEYRDKYNTNKLVYDIYTALKKIIAAKKEAEGIPFTNPYNNPNDIKTITYQFEREISNSLPKILPGTMIKYNDIIKTKLQQAFEAIIKQYQ